ncbi:glycosyltransferase [Limnobacter sp.]|uniref:glycosyltransferase n=1 Tax=Limnobacter sp. TaxID=2003368 RepID=UPI0035243AF0
MRVLHIVPSLNLSHGGPSRSVVALTDHLAEEHGINISLLSASDSSCSVVESHSSVISINVQPGNILDRYFFLCIRSYLRSIPRVSHPDLVHIHGVWHPACHWGASFARTFGIPYVIQPRGMLEPWPLAHKKAKKSLAMLLYQRKDLYACSAFVATASQEADNIRRLGFSKPIVTIPNGVESFAPFNPTLRDFNKSIRTALFMSRLHVKKGVIELVEAWSAIRPVGWRLRIVGPDDGGHRAAIIKRISQLGVSDVVDLVDEAKGSQRVHEYMSAHLFILPTYSENFGMVIAEALSLGLPVLTTNAAPWGSIQSHQCGWWIEPGLDSLLHMLPVALATEGRELELMSMRARQLAKEFDWVTVAKDMKHFYSDLLANYKYAVATEIDNK